MDKIGRVVAAVTTHAFTLVAVAFCLFHLYMAATGPLTAFEQRVIHLSIGIVMVFLVCPARKELGGLWKIVDWGLCLSALAIGAYFYFSAEDIAFRLGIPDTWDLISGGALIILLLESTRRVLGWPLPIIACAAILYGLEYELPE